MSVNDWKGLVELATVSGALLLFYIGYRMYDHGVENHSPAEMTLKCLVGAVGWLFRGAAIGVFGRLSA